MVTVNQLQTGILKYVSTDIMPHLDGWKKLAVGGYINLASGNALQLVNQIKNHPAVSMLGVFDDANNVDLDKLYAALSPMFQNNEKYTIPIPLAGDLTVDKTDLEKIYRYAREG